ncbi:MAG: Small-conductance mechanosensitive channel MscMJ [Candidatus Heimdallarchaeota archaeon LC_2]|nr:MAG: Small-conductance mechanosensitive channel MscMJ [Candidatus Heimdallarchaeota archaeon LC_2]
MSILSDFIDSISTYYKENIEDYELAGVSGTDYLLALLLFVVYGIILFLIRIQLKRFLKTLQKMGDKPRETTFITSCIKILSKWFILIVAFYAASSNITSDPDFPDGARIGVNLVLLIVVTRYLLKFSGQLVDEIFEEIVERRPDLQHLAEFLKLFVKAIVWIFVSLWFFLQLGVNITAYLAGLSILGLAMAFALQNVITDVFASITLYLDKPFEVGDSIKVGTDAGKVEQIGLRSTQIRTSVGNLLIISNRELVSKRIHNNTDMKERRVTLNLGVDCTTSVTKLKEIPQWSENIINKVENTRFARAHLTTLGTYSWDFQIVYYITTPAYGTFLDAQQEVNLNILEKLEKEGINIPYPTNTVLTS